MRMTDSTKKTVQATRQVQRALRRNPNDIASLLQLAAILGNAAKPDLDQKRRVLQQVLSLEPKNTRARQMLFEMDRAEIGGNPARLSLAVILNDPSSRTLPEAPLVLRYSVVRQLLVYFCLFCVLFAGFGFPLVFLLIPLWFVSVVVEINDSGLKVSRLFGMTRTEVAWKQIREIKPVTGRRGIKIVSQAGKTVTISARMNGYPFILAILQQMRPDLFTSRRESRQTSLNVASVVAKDKI